MIYIYRCTNKECTTDKFEVEQKMSDVHEANCPVCGQEANRVYTMLSHSWPKEDYTKDGKLILNPDFPHVPTGTKYTKGWTPKNK